MLSASVASTASTPLQTEPPAAAQQGLIKTLTLPDLLFFGIANILGSGAANLAGHAVFASGSAWSAQIAAVTGLLLGSSKTYAVAHEKYQSNDAEADLIAEEIGSIGRRISSFMIVLFNIVSTVVGLVFITRIINPTASYAFSVMLAIQLAIFIIAVGLYGIELNKTLINTVTALCIGVIVVFGGFAVSKWLGGAHIQNVNVATGNSVNPIRAFLYIFFIMAGFDVLIKFTEEAADTTTIPKAFYGSNIISGLLLLGLCFAYIVFVPMRGLKHADNAFADIAKGIFGDNEASIMKWIIIGFILISSLVNTLGVSRYLYSELKGTSAEGWRELNASGAPWKILLSIGSVLIGFIIINNIDKLVSFADLALVGILSMVGWSAARTRLKAGEKPWIESLTTLGLFGVGGLSIRQLFQKNDKNDYGVAL